ncbi:MCP four helix bundle domain-containing protein [Neopusillimonas aromaticivorans]|uniref:MCP four helix bundle domain-containing protein n=1 Tax=Neopusillimonas aromaticivorans TaxID=2979868 RepID=UPI0025917DAE|nr:MCP four helix bundle domain-containing protein [Neopusillimonas aromaticivorans]WJJ93229.1 MCP four helix bundle domain-containing protein [Neopusillimonas aromaticivorans]
MKWFNNLKVGSKLIGGFLVVAFIGGVIGVQGILKTSQMSDLATEMYQTEAMGIRHVAEVNIDMLNSSNALRGAMMAFDDAERDRELYNVDRYLAEVFPSWIWLKPSSIPSKAVPWSARLTMR